MDEGCSDGRLGLGLLRCFFVSRCEASLPVVLIYVYVFFKILVWGRGGGEVFRHKTTLEHSSKLV